jgi:hypothetical protein
VAEDDYSVVALVGADEWHSIESTVEPVATDFANWALGQNARDKQWDLYVIVLIASVVANDSELADIETFMLDTRYVRRLVRHGVEPEMSALRTALAALLPVELPQRVAERDPLGALASALRSEGVESQFSQRMVEEFMEARRP